MSSYGRIKGARAAILPPTTNAFLNYTSIQAVQNTWYTALDVRNARIIFLLIGDTVAAENLELRLTIDGQAFTGAQAAAVPGGFYTAGFNGGAGTAACIVFDVSNGWGQYRAFFVEARHIVVEIRKTSAVGASFLRVQGIVQQL